MRIGCRSQTMQSGSPAPSPRQFTASIPGPIRKLPSFRYRAIRARAWHRALAVCGYRFCGQPNSLVRVNASTNRISAILPLGPAGPEGGITASSDSVWIVSDNAGTLVRIDPATDKVRQKISIAAGSYNPCFGEDAVWITSGTANRLTAVDATTGEVKATIAVGPKPRFRDGCCGFDLDSEPGRRNSYPCRCAHQEGDCHNRRRHSRAGWRHRMGSWFHLGHFIGRAPHGH